MWYGPHRSTCSNSKILLVVLVLSGKGILVCLAMGHMAQVKGCLVEKSTGMVEILLIFTNGTCPNLVCHKNSAV